MEHIKSARMFLELGIFYLVCLIAFDLTELPDPKGCREGLGRIALSLLFLGITIIIIIGIIGGSL